MGLPVFVSGDRGTRSFISNLIGTKLFDRDFIFCYSFQEYHSCKIIGYQPQL
jgi:hypothetical protein